VIVFFHADCSSLYFIDDQGIELIHLEAQRTTPWTAISEDIVLAALKVLLEPSNYPMCIMCDLGRHRTGVKRDAVI